MYLYIIYNCNSSSLPDFHFAKTLLLFCYCYSVIAIDLTVICNTVTRNAFSNNGNMHLSHTETIRYTLINQNKPNSLTDFYVHPFQIHCQLPKRRYL